MILEKRTFKAESETTKAGSYFISKISGGVSSVSKFCPISDQKHTLLIFRTVTETVTVHVFRPYAEQLLPYSRGCLISSSGAGVTCFRNPYCGK